MLILTILMELFNFYTLTLCIGIHFKESAAFKKQGQKQGAQVPLNNSNTIF